MAAILPFLLLAALPQTPYTRPPVRVDAAPPGADVHSPAIAVEGGRAVAVWVQTQPGVAGAVLMGARSSDLGRSWSPPFVAQGLPGSAELALDPGCVALEGGRVFVCFRRAPAAVPKVAYVHSWAFAADGAGSAFPLDLGFPPGAADVELVRMEVVPGDDDVIVAARTRTPTSQGDLSLVKCLDSASAQSAPVHLDLAAEVGAMDLVLRPTLPAALEIHVAWTADASGIGLHELHYQTSGDGGLSWLPGPLVLAGGQSVDPRGLDLEAQSIPGTPGPWSRLAVAYQEVSALCGVSVVTREPNLVWSPPERVAGSLSPACIDRAPQVFLGIDELVVSWTDDRAGVQQPWMAWRDHYVPAWTEQALGAAATTAPLLGRGRDQVVVSAFWLEGLLPRASWSRSLATAPVPAFALSPGFGNSFLSQPALARDAAYGDTLCAWRMYTTLNGRAEVRVAGFRNAQAEAVGALVPGGQFAFLASGFPESESGATVVFLASDAPGLAALPGDGRITGLAPGALLSATATNPVFRGVLTAGGVTATGPLTIPPSLPPGTTLRFAAVSTGGPLAGFGSLTDPRILTVQ